eukprot:487315-Prymnesium_polylepis.1
MGVTDCTSSRTSTECLFCVFPVWPERVGKRGSWERGARKIVRSCVTAERVCACHSSRAALAAGWAAGGRASDEPARGVVADGD